MHFPFAFYDTATLVEPQANKGGRVATTRPPSLCAGKRGEWLEAPRHKRLVPDADRR